MTALDYFLYDNRTWSVEHGSRDWRIKAATGVLAHRADLRSEFENYCAATRGEHGGVEGFQEAIGGFRAQRGYLLCVTLFNRDHANRPSQTFIGLWCPDAATLETALAGDPIKSAKAVWSEPLPARLAPVPSSVTLRPRPRTRTNATAFHHFDQQSTPREVREILLGAIRGRSSLPNILGITASAECTDLARKFDLLYIHPMDADTERALAHRLSPPEPSPDLWLDPDPPAPPAQKQHSSAVMLQPEHRSASDLALILAIAFAVTVGIVMITKRIENDVIPEPTRPSAPAPEPLEPLTKRLPATALLQSVRRSVEEFKTLDPELLRSSRGFRAAEEVDVVDEHKDDRARVRDAYASLLEIRTRLLKRPESYVAYYFEEQGGTIKPDVKLTEIAAILRERPLGGEACASLREAFAFEFESDSVVRRWCVAASRLERVAASLSSTR